MALGPAGLMGDSLGRAMAAAPCLRLLSCDLVFLRFAFVCGMSSLCSFALLCTQRSPFGSETDGGAVSCVQPADSEDAA
jgi:hypothetical protein